MFVPPLRFIISISLSPQCVVTFSEEHFFKIGEIITIKSSKPYGMTEINNLSSRIIDLSSDTVTLEIDTSNFTAFVYPPVGVVQIVAVAVPSGSGIIPLEYTPTVTLQDVFDNLPG